MFTALPAKLVPYHLTQTLIAGLILKSFKQAGVEVMVNEMNLGFAVAV
ncbi:MAG: hypothetical protein Pars92KO_31280 [Parasphingorhabdus sp.]